MHLTHAPLLTTHLARSASRMESHGLSGKIHISRASYSAIQGKDKYVIKERGMINVKGKGPMQTYLINSSDPQVSWPGLAAWLAGMRGCMATQLAWYATAGCQALHCLAAYCRQRTPAANRS
jgi:hypothetical protein